MGFRARSLILILLFFIGSCAFNGSERRADSASSFYVVYSANSALQVEKLRYIVYTVMANKMDLHIKTINLSGRNLGATLSALRGKKLNFILIDDYKKFATSIAGLDLHYNLFAYSDAVYPDPNFVDLSKNDNSSLDAAFFYALDNGYARIAIVLDHYLKHEPNFLKGQEVLMLAGVDARNLEQKLEKLEAHFMEVAGNKETSAVFIDMKQVPYQKLEKVANRLDIAGVNMKFFIFNAREAYQGNDHIFETFSNSTKDMLGSFVLKSPKEFANLQMSDVTGILKNLCIFQGLAPEPSRLNRSYIMNKKINFSCLGRSMYLNGGLFGMRAG